VSARDAILNRLRMARSCCGEETQKRHLEPPRRRGRQDKRQDMKNTSFTQKVNHVFRMFPLT